MLVRIDLRDGRLATADLRTLLPRAQVTVATAVEAIAGVCDDVRDRGLSAVREATARFDGVSGGPVRVPAAELAKAADEIDPALRAALTEAIRRARLVHTAQRRDDVTVEVTEGASVTERWVPVRRVGLYVPGGLVAYPSSVVMNVVPAQVAGVRSLAVASPPKGEFGGLPNPAILAACHLLGVDEVYAVGGAQAVALFAHGAAADGPGAGGEGPVERVDLVTGPGNVYVTAAKRYLQGIIGIDSEAGPTEIGILADDTADPVFVAADLIAQAEHDENAACLLVTDSEALLEMVEAQLAIQVPATRHTGRVQAALAAQAACVLVDDLDDGLTVVDEWAAEHLEVITADARERAARVTNAGAIFVGAYSPVSLGDYLAGSNHVLPTSGTAKHSSGLSVQSFLRGIHVIDYSRDALAQVAPHVTALGTAEDLLAHVDAVALRIQ